jgi:hypothetical protein
MNARAGLLAPLGSDRITPPDTPVAGDGLRTKPLANAVPSDADLRYV